MFLPCLAFFLAANFTPLGNQDFAPWALRGATLQLIPDLVLPFTIGATWFVIALVLYLLGYQGRAGWIPSTLVAVSIPVGAVGVFELIFKFLFQPSNFWIQEHLSFGYWGYAISIASFAQFGIVGADWWVLDRWWGLLLAGTIAGLAAWKLVGFPLPVSPLDGHVTPGWELGIALAINVALKWAVFALLTLPVVNDALTIHAKPCRVAESPAAVEPVGQ